MSRLVNCGTRKRWKRKHAWRQRSSRLKTPEMTIKTKRKKWTMLKTTVTNRMMVMRRKSPNKKLQQKSTARKAEAVRREEQVMMGRKVRMEMAKRIEAEGAIVAAKAEESRRISLARWSGKPSLRQMVNRTSRTRNRTKIKKAQLMRRLKIKKIPGQAMTTKHRSKLPQLQRRC